MIQHMEASRSDILLQTPHTPRNKG